VAASRRSYTLVRRAKFLSDALLLLLLQLLPPLALQLMMLHITSVAKL